MTRGLIKSIKNSWKGIGTNEREKKREGLTKKKKRKKKSKEEE